MELIFHLVSEVHVNGIWEYTIQAQINQQEYGMGKGSSKKVAEQIAAKETFELLGEI